MPEGGLFVETFGRKRMVFFGGVIGDSGRSDKLLRVFMPPETGCRLESLQQSLVDLVPVSQRGQNTERKQDSV